MTILAVEGGAKLDALPVRNSAANSLKVYFRLVLSSLKSQLQYRASFALMALGQFMTTIIEFIAIWALFDRFGNLQGWTIGEVSLFYGIIHCSFAVAEAFSRGFDVFPGMVKSGAFDTVLTRPRSTVLQLLGAEFQLMRIGRFLQGVLIFYIGASRLSVDWNAWRIALVLFAALGGVCLFSGLFVLFATAAFWTTEALEIFNTMTYGGVEASQFPMTIYKPWFRVFFTVVVPLATINYFPLHAILGRTDPLQSGFEFQCFSPAIGIVFLLVALQVWKLGVRRYCSTGS